MGRPMLALDSRRTAETFNGFPSLGSLSERDYILAAQVIYLVALAITMLAGLRHVVGHRDSVGVFLRPTGRPLWIVIALMVGLGLATIGAMWLRGGGALTPIYHAMLVMMLFSTATAAVCYPLAVVDDSPQPTAPGAYLKKVLPWVPLALAWSGLSVYVIGLLVEGVTVNEQGLAGQINPDDPLSFLAVCLFAMCAAIMEEIIFRGGLIALLRRLRIPTTAAIVVAAFVFALGHAQYMRPVGVKEVQIFGFALMLGYVRVRHGLNAAIIIHFAHNYVLLMITALFPNFSI